MAEARRPGEVIGGRYRLEHRLGGDGSGRTWLAYDEAWNREVAVKELLPPPGLTGREREVWLGRTARWVRVFGRLDGHPNVAGGIDLMRAGETMWTVMRLVNGESLADRLLARGPLPPADSIRILSDVLSALEVIHNAGIVHGGVRPTGVILTPGGRVVLLGDPEGAAQQEASARVSWRASPARAPYTSPQLAQGDTAMPADDLFALGVTLYEMVEGHPPFRGGELGPAMRRAGPLAELIEGLLRTDPEERLTLPEVRRFVLDFVRVHGAALLERAAATRPIGAAPSAAGPPPYVVHVPRARFRQVALLLALAVVCLVLAGPVLAYVTSPQAAAHLMTVLPWTAFLLALAVLAHQVRIAVRKNGPPASSGLGLSLSPPTPWSPQERAARRAAAERAVDAALLRIDQKLAAASPRSPRNGALDD